MNPARLKVEIERHGMSVPKLASKIGIGKKAMYQKMRGETQFTQREIGAIAKELDLKKDGLLAIFFADVVS